VVVLHGGPGGSATGQRDFLLGLFDLRRWRVVLMDQRGCGRSRPRLELRENTTWHLVDDVEAVRRAAGLGDRPWTLFGGSWGSALALAYWSRYPASVAGLVLRGVCLMEPWEMDWMYASDGGAARIWPEGWAAFEAGSGVKRQRTTVRQTLGAYQRRLRSTARRAAARAWTAWEHGLSFLEPARHPDRTSPRQREELAVLENHYFRHGGWLRPGELLAAARRIPATVPVEIVQGRYDLVCPAASAVALAAAVPHARLTMVSAAGHSAAEEGIKKLLSNIIIK
jgi:proline iminopeptidase